MAFESASGNATSRPEQMSQIDFLSVLEFNFDDTNLCLENFFDGMDEEDESLTESFNDLLDTFDRELSVAIEKLKSATLSLQLSFQNFNDYDVDLLSICIDYLHGVLRARRDTRAIVQVGSGKVGGGIKATGSTESAELAETTGPLRETFKRKINLRVRANIEQKVTESVSANSVPHGKHTDTHETNATEREAENDSTLNQLLLKLRTFITEIKEKGYDSIRREVILLHRSMENIQLGDYWELITGVSYLKGYCVASGEAATATLKYEIDTLKAEINEEVMLMLRDVVTDIVCAPRKSREPGNSIGVTSSLAPKDNVEHRLTFNAENSEKALRNCQTTIEEKKEDTISNDDSESDEVESHAGPEKALLDALKAFVHDVHSALDSLRNRLMGCHLTLVHLNTLPMNTTVESILELMGCSMDIVSYTLLPVMPKVELILKELENPPLTSPATQGEKKRSRTS